MRGDEPARAARTGRDRNEAVDIDGLRAAALPARGRILRGAVRRHGVIDPDRTLKASRGRDRPRRAAGGAHASAGLPFGREMSGAGLPVGETRLEGGAGHGWAMVFPASCHDSNNT